MAVIAQRAPAKVNLTLRVLGQRPDGFHALESLVVFADVGDRLTLDPSLADGFSITGPMAAAIEGDNLVERVLALAREAAPELAIGHLHLEKQLPVAAGLGGGSADAAAAIRAILARHPGQLALARLVASAARLGADVPACLLSRALVMRGIGESVAPLRRFTPVHAVLVNPRLPLATAAVFEALAAGPASVDSPPLDWPDEIGGLDDLMALIADRPNDLEAPARRLLPIIGDMLETLARLPGCRLARMSGSGPTCFGVFDTSEAAELAASQLRRDKPGWWVTPAMLA